ncbi:MAG: efflux RND transporter periplasmic adaptor subunit [Sulfuriflexus sp.]|nr:efflux RND transporter periplasmic adaptor subunit [Sulfuriflexus sp.]
MKRLILVSVILNAFITPFVFAADIDGEIVWSQRVELSTTVSGIVDEVLVNAGDKVEKNDVLLHLQSDRFNAALTSATAIKKDAKYKLKEAEREWDRAQELYERTVLSDSDLQLAENLLVAAQAVFAKAKSQYINAKRDVVESVIRAPFAAVVLQRDAQPGQVVVTRMHSVPLITIAATGNYHASGAVLAAVAGKLVSGQAISVTVSGKRFDGKLVSIGFEPIKNTQTYSVVVSFVTDGSLLRSGQSATIHLP